MRSTIASLLLFLLAFPLSLAVAQTTGTISGTVMDATSATVPGAKVVIRNVASGAQREVSTTSTGQYTFPLLPPGNYEIEFSQSGFATVVRQAVLNVTERISVNASLQVSAVNERIEVSATIPLLQTESAALGRVMEGNSIKELPLSTRNFTQLLALSPGTSGPLNDAGALGRGTQNISSGGGRLGSNAIYIDGVDSINLHSNTSNENAFASNGVVAISPEAIQEFKAQTGLYDAQSGRSGGANITLVTKSGTPAFHGSLFEFLRNDVLNANSYFFNATGQTRPVLKQNQFGGTIGGPIRKQGSFFFFSYQGTRQRNGLSGSSSLSLPQIPADRSRASLGRAFRGTTGARGGPAILEDGSNINPVALSLLNLQWKNGDYVIPSPQRSGTGVNYAVSIPATFTEDQYVTNLDHEFSDDNRLAFKSVIARQPTFQPLPAANLPGFGTRQQFISRLFSLNDIQIVTPYLINEARFGLSRLVGAMEQENQIPLRSIGMQRFNGGDFPDIPQITVTGAFSIGYSVNADQGVALNTWHFTDTLSWTHGSHEVRAGAELRRYQDNYFSNNRMRGTLTMQRFGDFLLGLSGSPINQGGNGTGFSNVNSSSVASGVASRADRITDLAFFVQDSWKLGSRLTLNSGMRWEYLGLPVDRYGRNASFDPRYYQPPAEGGATTAGFVQQSNAVRPVPNIPMVSPTLIHNEPIRNFGPRLGLAYKLTGQIVMRAGYGVYYDRLSNQLGLLESLSLPNYVRTDLQGAANVNSTLDNPFPTLPQRSNFPVVPLLYGPPYNNDRPALGLNAVDPTLRSPYLQQWGLNFQWQSKDDLLVEVGYAGSKGSALASQRLIAQARLASPEVPVNGITTNTAANAQLRVPYVGFSPTGLVWLETATDSRYNSLQASVTRRLSKRLRLLAAYTYAKSLDNNSASATGATFSQFDGDQNNLSLNRGLSDFDRTHRLAVNFSYTLPGWGGRWNQTAIGKRLFTGWQLAGVAIAQSGTPFSITDSSGGSLYGTTSSRASIAPGASVQTAKLSGKVQDRLDAYFDRSAFVPAGSLYGNAGRNILRGPRQRNIDLTVNKTIPVAEDISLQFRAEFFNLFNFVNFANPGGNVSAASYGVIRNTQGNPRVTQVALKLIF